MKSSRSRLMALTFALWRSADTKVRGMRLLEQAVLVVALSWALSGQIRTNGLPYTVFLLCGISPWFYFKEIVERSLEGSSEYSGLLCAWGCEPAIFCAAQALCALPTLLFWTAVSVAAALFCGISLKAVYLLPYLLFCNLFNAVAQGLLASAFAPLFSAAEEGIQITLPLLFWTTPIVWPFIYAVPDLTVLLMRLNPLFYLTEGMRMWILSGILPPLVHTVLFFGAATATGIFGLFSMNRVWRGLSAQSALR